MTAGFNSEYDVNLKLQKRINCFSNFPLFLSLQFGGKVFFPLPSMQCKVAKNKFHGVIYDVFYSSNRTKRKKKMKTLKEEKIKQLWQLYESVRDTLDDYEEEFEGIRASKPVKLDDALEFAERIAPSSFAPMGWTEGFPLLNAFPPAPQGEQMRVGKLADYNRAIEQRIKNHELIPPSDTSLHRQKTPAEILRNESIEEAKQKTISLRDKLRLRKERLASEKESQMVIEEANTSLLHPSDLIPEEEEKEEEKDVPEPYIPVKARRINLSFAPAEESESEEDEEEED